MNVQTIGQPRYKPASAAKPESVTEKKENKFAPKLRLPQAEIGMSC